MLTRHDVMFALIVSLFVHSSALVVLSNSSNPTLLPPKRLTITVSQIEEHTEELEVPRASALVPQEHIEVVSPPDKEQVKPRPTRKKPSVRPPTTMVKHVRVKNVRRKFAPQNGEARKLRANYEQLVASLLAKQKRYPRIARRRGQEGSGAIRITLLSNGELAKCQILQTTGEPLLDKEMLSMAKRASPFPAFPENYRKMSLTIVAPITFELR